MPIYNVEDYLEECLRSVARQTLAPEHGIEVVLVDDGSTDGSTRIARAFAADDPRFRYVHQENAGLSAARNTGVRHTSPDSTYLTFVDSDDIVPHDAYARMLASLDDTGSDFATGNVWRLGERGRQQAWQYKWLTRAARRTHITRHPALLSDRVAWNKVFRKDFWLRHAFTFPEGKLYEDTPVMIPAHFLASSVDVLREHVYYWRVREGSITRRRSDVKGVTDRIAACRGVSAFLAERFPEQKRTYDVSCLRDDFVYFLDGLPMGGPEYRSAFLDGTGAFLDEADPSVIADLPVELRVKWQLVRERRLDDLIGLWECEQHSGTAFHVRGRLRRTAAHPTPAGPPLAVDSSLTRLKRRELPVVARVSETSFDAQGRLRISGYAYVRNLEAARRGQTVKAGLLKSSRHKGRLRTVPTRTVAAPQATADSGQRLHDYDLSGFEMTLDPKKLKIRGRWRPGNWQLGIVVAGHGQLRRAAVRAVDGPAAQSVVRDLGDGTRLVLAFSNGRLVLKVQTYAARIEQHARVGEDVLLTGRLYGGLRPTGLHLKHKHSDTEITCPVTVDGTGFTARVPLPELEAVPPAPHLAPREVEPRPGDRWQANLVLADGSLKSVAAVTDLPPGRYATGAGRELCTTANDTGQLVVELTRQPIADAVRWRADGVLEVEGSLAAASWGETELVLRHSARGDEVTVPVERTDDRFRAAFPPASVHGGLPLREGRWYAFLRETAPGPDVGEVHARDGMPVRLLTSLCAELPRKQSVDGREYAADRRFGDRLLIESGPVLPPAERGAYRRERLRTEHYAQQRELPLREAVLWFDGGSPRAVHEELVRRGVEIDHLWVTDDGRTRVPPNARGVERHSAEWYEALARCRRIVTGDHLPDWFERRDGQTVVQTWHGSPLKRIGTDLTDTLYADHGHLDALPRLSAQWSVLVTPNRYAIPHMTRALHYEGEILQAGSPRNDLFFAEDREKVADRVRAELGLDEDRRIVLYAPTYRDHLARARGRFRYEPALDAAELERSLGADHTLLVRRHPLASGRLTGARAPFVRDVSYHPQPAELLLVADVLVTDYSALMFDFAHTGRPMLFLTPDLEHYRDTLRGFYVDLERRAPGPLLRTTAELAAALGDLDAVADRYADAYATFRQAYCDLDDGRAAGRVADRLLR
ncbi:bifunctional glycosyltransferase/CDP-glycerol:glycerophosphate glycerophosphotransferase [Streptomyces luteolus]|uniref:CDP-glycerol glycerophosphotransferase family protein n=1 Tax=Streptomyces luteolus TaxID=3043615 RepID=A0ABT6T1G0_9ACTN|nr:CDP-glycerol glycerophosphotransferase family protein [Streptomyces sp. B-S-A12]MDI3421699.1 CDP-glycerol glycerophosphotransferase family protein [Streptomyces sp. B-S-A12]